MNINDVKFKLRLAETRLTEKPAKDDAQWNHISKALSNAEQSELTIHELMERATSGNVFQLGELKREYTASEKRELKELSRSDLKEFNQLKSKLDNKQYQLVETNLIAIDIDNDAGNVAPQELIDFINPTSYYFTFSHQTISEHSKLKQNAMRLLFALNQPVKADMVKYIEEHLKAQITRKFPEITLYKGEVEGTSSKKMILGSQNKDFGITNHYLNVADYEAGYRFLKELEELQSLAKLTYRSNSVSENELIEMAQYLANKGITLDFNKWTALAIGVWHSAQSGQYSEETALNILRTFDKNQQNDDYYMKYKRDADIDKPATIATLIKLAKDNGFKRNQLKARYREDIQQVEIPTEPIQIDTHISPETMLELLNSSDKNILIDAPTGSGKTTAIIDALKIYLEANPDVYAYIAVPARALAKQLAEIHNLGSAVIEGVNVKKAMNESFKNNRIFLNVGSYDKAGYFMNEIGDSKAIIIADEAHKEVLDYGYRRKAIKELFDLRNDDRVVKFMSLSGTPQEIDLNRYDKQCVFSKRDDAPIFDELQTVLYHKSNEFLEVITKAIATEIERGQKVLAFVNRKEDITTIQKVLKEQGYKIAIITSESTDDEKKRNKSKHYRKLLNEEKFPDCDALIATTVIADGINILNENENYTCLIATHYIRSQLFNASTIKQATNRFRNKYKRVLIPMFVTLNGYGTEDYNRRMNQTALYGLETEYRILLQQAEKVAGITQSRFKNSLTLYQPSMLEKANGLIHQNHFKDKIAFNFEKALQEENRKEQGYKDYDEKLVDELIYIRERLFSVDERAIRKKASANQEDYYKYFPSAFINALETILKTKSTCLSMGVYLDGVRINEQAIIEDLKFDAIGASDSQKEKMERVAETLTADIFYLLQSEYARNHNTIREDSELWQALSKALCKRHAKTLKDILPFCEHEQAIRILQLISRDADIHRFKKSLEAVETLEHQDETAPNTLTKNILDVMQAYLNSNEVLTADDLDDYFKSLAKKLKQKTVKAKNLESLYNQFFRCEESRKRIDGKRPVIKINHRFITLDDVAKEYEFSQQEINEILKRYKYEKRIS